MPVRPPFDLIQGMAKTRSETTPMWGQALLGILQGVNSYQAAKSATYDRETEANKQLVTNYSLRPMPTDGTGGMKAGDVVSSMNRGRVPSSMSPNLAGMEAVPKMDVNALPHILKALIDNQPPGSTTPVINTGDGKGGLVKPGAVPGLSTEATVTNTPKPPPAGKDAGAQLDKKFESASNRARATISQMIQQASADPASAKVSNYPILDTKYSHNQFLKEFEREARLGGAPEEEIQTRLKKVSGELKASQASFDKDFQSGMAVLSKVDAKKDPAKRQQILQVIKQRLLQTYPMMAGDINQKVK